MTHDENYSKLTALIADIDGALTNDVYLNYHKVGFMYEVLMKYHDKWEE